MVQVGAFNCATQRGRPSPARRIPCDERLVSDREFLLALDPRLEAVRGIRAAACEGDLPRARAALLAHFRTRPAPRWFFDLRDGRRGPLVSAEDPDTGADAPARSRSGVIARANGVCANVVRVTGDLPLDLGPGLAWRTQELRGLTALPSSFKRHGFIRQLAAAYALTGRARYARQFGFLVDRWRRDWPLVVDEDMNLAGVVFSRADGHKTMPTAARWLAWLDALYSGIVFDPAVSLDSAFGFVKSLWFTALQYRRFAGTPHAAANHHLWSRGVMPVVFGAMLPEFPDVRALVRQGRPVIDWHARHGFLPDGGYEERSLNYTLFVLRMYVLAMAMERLNGVRAMGQQARAAVRRCADATARLILPNGALPDIGDGGMRGPAGVAGQLAALADRAGSRLADAALRRLGLTCHVPGYRPAAFAGSRPAALQLLAFLPQSGYLVARDGWTPDSSAMAMSVPGPGLPNHGHDDALSLQLIARGEAIVGTPYSELKAIVHQDRYIHGQACGQLYAMTSHNVVLVAGQPLRSPRDLAGRHGAPPIPVRARVRSGAGLACVVARHAGYPGVRVARAVRFVHGRGWTVVDSVRGAPEGRHTARWHFEYGVEVKRAGRSFVARKGAARLLICAAAPGGCRTRLYRDSRWMGRNPLRPGVPAPWVLDIRFAGERLETAFAIAAGR